MAIGKLLCLFEPLDVSIKENRKWLGLRKFTNNCREQIFDVDSES